MPLTLEQLNAASPAEALALLVDGLTNTHPGLPEEALAQRPFRSLAHLRRALAQGGTHGRAGRAIGPNSAPTPNWRARPWWRKASRLNPPTNRAAGPHRMHAQEFERIPAAQRSEQRTLRLPVHPARAGHAARVSPAGNHRHFALRPDNHPEFQLAEALRTSTGSPNLLERQVRRPAVLGNDVICTRRWPATLTRLRRKGQLTVT